MGRAEAAERRQQLLQLLATSPKPVSVRNLFYQMVARFGYPKVQVAYQRLSDDLVKMRWAGEVRFEDIADASRNPLGVTSRRNLSAEEAVTEALMDARAVTSVWKPFDLRPHIWVESRSTAGMIRPITRGLEVGLWPTGGHSSLSFLKRGADDRPTHVGVLTDFDDSGQWIGENVERDMGRLGCYPEFVKLAVTEEQIEMWQLPTRPPKRAGARIDATVELEAIPVDKMRSLVAKWLVSLLPEGEWEAYQVRKEEAAQEVTDLVAQIREEMS